MTADPADDRSTSPPRAPMSVAEAWALWAAAGLALLFVLACVGIAFDVPALRNALDARSLFR